jgi:hypothetical protein
MNSFQKVSLNNLYSIIILLAALSLTACTSKEGDKTASTPNAASNTTTTNTAPQVAAAPPVKKCSNGSDAKVFKGQCKGVWKVSKNTKTNAYHCEYNWSPVSCEKEGVAGDPTQACYGVDGHEYGSSEPTPADCSKKFQDPPKVADYQLQCCAK